MNNWYVIEGHVADLGKADNVRRKPTRTLSRSSKTRFTLLDVTHDTYSRRREPGKRGIGCKHGLK